MSAGQRSPRLVVRVFTVDDQAVSAATPGKSSTPRAGIGRYPREIESAAYFCCLEALQNVARHAAGGLASMRYRLAAVGGELAIRSSPGHGTHVRGTIPLDEAP